MNEDLAKTKWCPMGRQGSIAEAALPINRGDGYCCIGSACMYGCDADGEWLGHCALAPPARETYIENRTPPKLPEDWASHLTASEMNALKRPIGKGVYNNPQPGDPDHPETPKTDISSGG